MAEWLQFFTGYGYWFLFGIGFLEYAGVPIAGAPIVIATGALVALGILHPVVAVLSVSLGGLLGEFVWYGLARWHGQRFLDMACGLATNPRACIHGVLKKIARVGPRYILPAKFIPGTGTLIAAAAGFAGIDLRTFLFYDAFSLLLWASAYMMIGWLFAPQIEAVGVQAIRLVGWLTVGVVFFTAVSVVWRITKVRWHRTAHAVYMDEM